MANRADAYEALDYQKDSDRQSSSLGMVPSSVEDLDRSSYEPTLPLSRWHVDGRSYWSLSEVSQSLGTPMARCAPFPEWMRLLSLDHR